MLDERPIQPHLDTPLVAALRQTIEEHFPGLWPAVEAALSVCATLLLADNSNPGALIYEGGPSSSKTTVADLFADHPQCYLSDNFTPASFVSHAANVPLNRLAQVDLLPRIRHKVLVTPELAPIFRGKEDELVNTFKIITRVLDGQGLQTDSGTHGRRGYRGDYLFAWIGATTPFEPKVWKVMAQLGSRLLFFRMDEREITVEELVESDEEMPYKERLALCKQALHLFLTQLFQANGGVRGVKWDASQDPRPVKEWVARMAKLLAAMRSEPLREADPDRQTPGFTPAKREQPWRVQAVLRNLARGHALVHDRRNLTREDLPLVAWGTVSSMPTECSKVFRVLVQRGGEPLTVEQVQAILEVKHLETVRSVMEDLDRRGVMEFAQGGPAVLRFRPDWAWCASPEFRAFLFREPIKNRGVCDAPVTSNLVQRQNEREERREETDTHTPQKMTGSGIESGSQGSPPGRLARTKAAVSAWLKEGRSGTAREIAHGVKKRLSDVRTILSRLETEGLVKVGTVRRGKGRPRREFYWLSDPAQPDAGKNGTLA